MQSIHKQVGVAPTLQQFWYLLELLMLHYQVINLEWGNFRSPFLPRTFSDEVVDEESVSPGDQVRNFITHPMHASDYSIVDFYEFSLKEI